MFDIKEELKKFEPIDIKNKNNNPNEIEDLINVLSKISKKTSSNKKTRTKVAKPQESEKELKDK